ncbi:hypothetical protein J437_LFUL014599 [Ladona fulva]|uniref:HTH CENPB-type domain-containing protein n=1 Tax=Ladona fulva TaxID=123851 RepID=A0A8K0KGP9_LADFU|nr:hypothetical protein J437_LFUL014599 [Ladona fulva]
MWEDTNLHHFSRKREKDSKHSDLYCVVFEWFLAARVTAEILKIDYFSASNGWLKNFGKRHGIMFNVSCGEVNDTDENTIKSWQKRLKDNVRH